MANLVDESECSPSGGSFECNICLDTVQDPVVTLCGHLYCWPCLFKWIQHQETSYETLETRNAQCPVCKTEVSEKTIVPLYGPSPKKIHSNEEKGLGAGLVIPPRPATPRQGGVGVPGRGGYQRLAPPPVAVPGHGGDMSINDSVVIPSPTIGMLGELVSGRILGELGSPLFGTPNSYNQVRIITRRERLQTNEADRSLSRIYSFLFCFIIFSLITFS